MNISAIMPSLLTQDETACKKSSVEPSMVGGKYLDTFTFYGMSTLAGLFYAKVNLIIIVCNFIWYEIPFSQSF